MVIRTIMKPVIECTVLTCSCIYFMAVDPIKTFQERMIGLDTYDITLNKDYRITITQLSNTNKNNINPSILSCY